MVLKASKLATVAISIFSDQVFNGRLFASSRHISKSIRRFQESGTFNFKVVVHRIFQDIKRLAFEELGCST